MKQKNEEDMKTTKQNNAKDFKNFISALSSTIMLTVMFGMVGVVLIWHVFIRDFTTLSNTELHLVSIIVGITILIGVGYLITMLVRLQAGINRLMDSNEKK